MQHLKINGIDFNKIDNKLTTSTLYDKYYKDSKKEFWFYACHTPIPGYFHDYDGDKFIRDFRTPERYKEYRECGFNVLYLQPNDMYYGEDFEASQLKKNIDNAIAGGIDKIIVCDERIHKLSAETEPLIGEGRQFQSFQDLVEFVKKCIAPYKDYGNGVVVGVMLVDEPLLSSIPQAAIMFKAITEAWEGVYVDQCLLPLDTSFRSMNGVIDEFSSNEEGYADYIDKFLTISDGKYFMMDSYPLRGNNTKSGEFFEYINPTHFRGMQILNNICNKHNARFYGCSCSCELKAEWDSPEPSINKYTEDEMYWQNNSYLIFGVKMFEYYTYWAKTDNPRGNCHIDGTSFINRDGTRTDMYYYMKRMHQEMQRFSQVMMNFEYKKVQTFKEERLHFSTNYLDLREDLGDYGNFTALKSVSQHHSSAALITELLDEKNNQLMYSVMNPLHPAHSRIFDNSLEIVLHFDSKYKNVEIWFNGDKCDIPLINGDIKVNIDAGHAVFILPY